MSAANEPIAILRDIETRARQNAAGLPQQVEIRQTWAAVAFRGGDARLGAPLDEVSEIITYPELARVPGTKSWVRGIANIRGNLLPIMDLRDFLTNEPCTLTARTRVLAVNHEEVYSGLVVDEVLGLRHFLEEEKTSALPATSDFIRGFLTGAYVQSGEHWGVFSMHALAESQLFMQAAV